MSAGFRPQEGTSLTRVQRMQRARRIGVTFGGVYLGWKANQLLASRLSRESMRPRWKRFHRESADHVYRTAVDLRGLILKGCQFLGTRSDLLPREWVRVLSRLQDRVPPKSFPVVRRTVERELGRRLESVFVSFAPQPIAAASLAQVHEALLRDGRRVAVKVQYPDVESLVRGDLANLRTLGRAIGWLERDFDPMPLLDELGEHVPRELDFLSEAHNAERIAALLESRGDVHVPAIHRRLSTRRVLVMDLVRGIKIDDQQGLRDAGVAPQWVVSKLVEVYSEQILRHGLFHADPHPGNLMIEPEGRRLILLDFGLVKELPASFRNDLLALLMAVLGGRAEQVTDALLRLGFRTRDDSLDSLRTLASVLVGLVQRATQRRFPSMEEWVRLGDRVAEQLRRNPIVRVPSHLVLVARCAGLLSGVSRSLGVRIDPFQMGRSLGASPSIA